MALDFSVRDSAIVHLDYNSTSIGLDFGNGPVRVRKIVITPDEDHTTHRISENTIELYTGSTNYQYEQIPADEFVFTKDENGVITIILNEVIENRYFKLNVLFDERDKTFDPIDNAEFINTLTAMLAVYSEATSRAEEYEYDSSGNRTLERITLVQTDEYSSYYYENSNRLKTDGKYAFDYDAAGNMVKKGNAFEIDGDEVTFTAIDGEGVEYWEYTFDLLNRLTKATKNGTLVAEYIYDALGYRVVKRSKGETTHYVFEGTEAIFEKNITTGKVRSYMYALGKHFARVDGVVGDSEAEVYYYHNDHLGSVRAVSDENGEVVWSSTYLPFGRQVEQESESFSEWHGFTGKAFNAETGLHYYNARWYSAEIGRFVSEDPARDGVNWYAYCSNNPLVFIDSTGLDDTWFDSAIEMIANFAGFGELIRSAEDMFTQLAYSTEEIMMIKLYGAMYGISQHEANILFMNQQIKSAVKDMEFGKEVILVEAGIVGDVIGATEVTHNMITDLTTINDSGVLKFGDNDLVLALKEHWDNYINEYGGKYYYQFSSDGNTTMKQIKHAMTKAEHIRFAVDDFNFKKIKLVDGSDIGGIPAGGFTTWEMWTIKNNKKLLNKTTFYRDGVDVTAEVLEILRDYE